MYEKEKSRQENKIVLNYRMQTYPMIFKSFDFFLNALLDAFYNDPKRYEPLSVLIKLAMLSFYPSGTKISFQQNMIHLQEPSLWQSIARTYQGDNRHHLRLLYRPLKSSLFMYNIEDIKPLLLHAKAGLNNLCLEYNESSATDSLKYYISMIDEKLESTDEISSVFNEWSKNELNAILDLFKVAVENRENNLPNDSIFNSINEILSRKE